MKQIIPEKSSEKVAKFVCDSNNFYNKLLEKMNKWGMTI